MIKFGDDDKKLEERRRLRIVTALSNEFRLILLCPIIFAFFIRFIPELIKPVVINSGEFILSSKATEAYYTVNTKFENYFIVFIITLIVLGILAYYSVEKAGTSDREKDVNPSITLVSSDNNLKKLIDSLFGRHQIFKNSNRNWPELQASFSLIMLIYLCVFLVQMTWTALYLFTEYNETFVQFLTSALNRAGSTSELILKFPIAILSAYFAIYIYIKKDYGDKWKYCADTYNKLIVGNEKLVLSTKCNVAIDVLYLDLWAKRGFCKFFKDTLMRLLIVIRIWIMVKNAVI